MIKVNAVSINHTGDYKIREEDQRFIQEIRSVYAYDPTSATYLCELTPSHELRYLHTYIVFTSQMVEDDLRDTLEQRYCYEDNEDMYMLVRDVRACKQIKECGDFETMDEACAYLNGNWPF